MKINEPKRIRPPYSVGNNSEKRERTGGKLYFYFPRIGSKVGRAGVGPMRPLVLKILGGFGFPQIGAENIACKE